MADRIEMARYYRQYQEAAVKCSRAKQDLDKIEKQLLAMPDPEALDDLLTKKEAAQAMYDELKEALADAESLAMTGQPRQTVKAAQEVQWFTPWGIRSASEPLQNRMVKISGIFDTQEFCHIYPQGYRKAVKS